MARLSGGYIVDYNYMSFSNTCIPRLPDVSPKILFGNESNKSSKDEAIPK